MIKIKRCGFRTLFNSNKMFNLSENACIGVIGAGAMGTGITQIAAQNGHKVCLVDASAPALEKSQTLLKTTFYKLAEKGKISPENAEKAIQAIRFTTALEDLYSADLVIEAIVENLAIKKEIFSRLAAIVKPEAILATNTSSLSVTSIASSVKNAERVLGLHFFNPPPLMPLVEVVPGLASADSTVQSILALMKKWGKKPVLAKDTPAFIVNRLARPFYGEAIRMMEEGIADCATIDWAMKTFGQFKMGPFELMDYIGHDVNYVVTETVFAAFFYDPRYRPSFSQKRLLEAGRLGKKSGHGFYNYGAAMPEPQKDEVLGRIIMERIVAMLINEAAEALLLGVASASDLDLAMKAGVNYPKGLLEWANEWGAHNVYTVLKGLQETYGDDRYRPSALLRQKALQNERF